METKDSAQEEPDRLPEDWWTHVWVANQLGGWFRRHLGLLHVTVSTGDRLTTLVYSGFFLEHSGRLHWITAAHCFEQIDDLMTDPSVTIEVARWMDHHKIDAARGIPVDLSTIRREHITSKVLDVAVAFPSSHEERLFRANPDYHPLDEGAWRGWRNASTDGLYVLGYPEEWRVDSHVDTPTHHETSFNASLATLPIVERLSSDAGSEPEGFWGREHCIYGRVALPQGAVGRTLARIEGMSGGPLLSVEQTPDKGIKYRLCGVQCSWLSKSKIVRAEPIEGAIGLIEQATTR